MFNIVPMQFAEAGKYIINRLSQELPAGLIYHDVTHTLDVYGAAERLAKNEAVSEQDLPLLLTAAWFHDSGYLLGMAEHEQSSCAIARETLPAFGYAENEIEMICSIILATRLPQTPTNHLGEILADADLDYLGRGDFFPRSEKLYRELDNVGVKLTKEDWDPIQIKFLESHRYFTQTARLERQAKKEDNLHLIKADLK